MTDITGSDQSPTVEVVARRDGEIILRQLCDTAEEAADLADVWEDMEGVEVVAVPISGRRVDEDTPALHERPDDHNDMAAEPAHPED